MKWDKDNEKIVCAAACSDTEVAIAKKVIMRAKPTTSKDKAMAKRGGKRLLAKGGGSDKSAGGGDKGGDTGSKGGADGGKDTKVSGKGSQDDRASKQKSMSKGKMSGKDKMAAIKKMQKAVIVFVPTPDAAKSKIVYKRTDK